MTVQVTTLPNGLRVVSEEMPRVETVSVGAWVAVGARHEPAEVSGISHLLEHMAFKGTRRRSARQIAEEIEAVGGYINAWTSREATAYYAKVLKEDLALAVDLIADITQEPAFDEDELAREREVILQEIGQAQDTPDDMVFEHFQAVAFPDQPLGRSVLGAREVVSAMSRDALVSYLHGNYHAGRIVLAAAGAVDHDKLVALAKTAFGSLPSGELEDPAAGAYRGGDYRESRDLEQVHLVLGLPGVSLTDDDFYPLSVYSTILGGGMSSRLFQEVREKRGLVYSVYSFTSAYTDTGLFGIYAGTGSGQVAELMPVIFGELHDLARAVDESELARAKAQIKSGIVMSLESTSARIEQLAHQMHTYGRVLEVQEVVEKVEAVTSSEVCRVGGRLLDGSLTTAAVGPVGTLPAADALAGYLKS
jgi:predicted Zn-dependent peptidase